MATRDVTEHQQRKRNWLLILGLLGIANYLIGFSSLLPTENEPVNFWLVKFYGYIFIPSVLILLPGSFLAITLWCAQLVRQARARVVILTSIAAVACIGLYLAISFFIFIPTFSIVGEVKHNGQTYYLGKHYDDLAYLYSFCESDATGFSGNCTYITWQTSDSAIPTMFVDQSTGSITVSFDNPKRIQRIGTKPTYFYPIETP